MSEHILLAHPPSLAMPVKARTAYRESLVAILLGEPGSMS